MMKVTVKVDTAHSDIESFSGDYLRFNGESYNVIIYI